MQLNGPGVVRQFDGGARAAMGPPPFAKACGGGGRGCFFLFVSEK